MQMNKTFKIFVTIAIIFVLTFANIAIVGKSAFVYAAEIVLEKQNEKTSNENVEFNVYFENSNNEKSYETSLDVNDSTSINVALMVKNSGYLKDAVIRFSGENDQDDSSYKINLENNLGSIVQEVTNNEIKLKLIDNTIIYNFENYINLNKLTQKDKITLKAIYVDNEGKEVEISKDIFLHINWTDKNDIKIETNTEKYVTYQTNTNSGFILQSSVKVSGNERINSLPIQETSLEIEVPKIENAQISKVDVIAKSTEFTNGLKDTFVKFDNTCWNYDKTEGIIKINVKNEANTEGKYYSSKGTDQYIITYTFENQTNQEKHIITKNSEVKAKIYNFGQTDTANKTETIIYDLSTKIGDLVGFDIENKTNEISKSYMYLNKNRETDFYEMEIKSIETLNVYISL